MKKNGIIVILLAALIISVIGGTYLILDKLNDNKNILEENNNNDNENILEENNNNDNENILEENNNKDNKDEKEELANFLEPFSNVENISDRIGQLQRFIDSNYVLVDKDNLKARITTAYLNMNPVRAIFEDFISSGAPTDYDLYEKQIFADNYKKLWNEDSKTIKNQSAIESEIKYYVNNFVEEQKRNKNTSLKVNLGDNYNENLVSTYESFGPSSAVNLTKKILSYNYDSENSLIKYEIGECTLPDMTNYKSTGKYLTLHVAKDDNYYIDSISIK